MSTATHRAVVKVVSTRANDRAPRRRAQLDWPSREPLLYQHGLPAEYQQAGIDTPKLLGSFERPGAVALWLEDLDGISGSALRPNNYERVAHRLGRPQGSFRSDDVAASGFPWSRQFLPDYLASWSDVGWDLILDDASWAVPLIADHFSEADRHALVELCADRHRMISWAARLPQTICHHAVWPNNVFDFGDHTTLVDWAFAGHGHIGADVGNLVTDSCGDLLQPTSMLEELDATSSDGYRAGLDEAGWAGDFQLARLGICILAAKWCWLVPHMLGLAKQEGHGVYGGVPVDSDRLFSERAAMLRFFVKLADEARGLARSIGL